MRARHLLLPLLLLSVACSDEPAAPAVDPVEAMQTLSTELRERPEDTAQEVEVVQILIGHRKSFRLKGIERSISEAERLAAELLVRIEDGEDFDTLRTQHSDDSTGGRYILTSQPPPAGSGKYARGGMAPGFATMSWKLTPGEVGIAVYDAVKNPFGYHIIKRLR